MPDFEHKIDYPGVSAVLAPCSARKTKLSVGLCATRLPRGTQETIAAEWLKRLSAVSRDQLIRAEHLYDGRTHRKIQTLVHEFGCDYFIASAGLGLVHANTRIPGYDLTLSAKAEQSIRHRITCFDEPRWWEHLQTGPFASAMERLICGSARVLIALTQPYARLLGSALSRMSPQSHSRLRIFGFGLTAALPSELHAQIICYDERLDVLFPGTKHDACARALIHFAKNIGKLPMQEIKADQQSVNQLLQGVMLPCRLINRERVSDAAIRLRIRQYVREGSSAAAALKHLRAHAGIACEEQRFKRLYREMNQ